MKFSIKKSDEAFLSTKKLQKPKNSSRIRRFTRREAIQFIPKFALANLMRSNQFWLCFLIWAEGREII